MTRWVTLVGSQTQEKLRNQKIFFGISKKCLYICLVFKQTQDEKDTSLPRCNHFG